MSVEKQKSLNNRKAINKCFNKTTVNSNQNINKTIDNKNCDFVFGNILLRKRLQFNNNININLNQYKCIECQFESNCLQILKEHQLKHKIKCQSKTSENQCLLRAHEKNIQRNNDNNNKDLNNTQNEFICDKCKQVFDNVLSLIAHKNKIHKQIVYALKRCFESKSTANQLKRVHNKCEEIKFKCNECEQCFSSSSDLIKHMNESHSKLEPIVEVCDWPQTQVVSESVSVNNKKSFNSTKSGEKLFECKKCEVFFNCSKDLSKHMIESHLKLGPKVRPQSQIQTISKLKLKNTEKYVHLVPEIGFDCFECGLHFEKLFDFQNHECFRDSNKNLKYNCDKCEFECITLKELKEHQSKDIHMNSFHPNYQKNKSIHKNAKLFECQKCEVFFQCSSDLSKHMIESHLKFNRSLYVCDWPLCQFETRSKSDIEIHKKLVHLKREALNYNECGLHFSKQFQYQKHKHFHDSIKNLKFKCNKCEFDCNSLKDLREHQSKHKRIKCQSKECDKTFAKKSIMKIHLKKFHDMTYEPIEEKFQCCHCNQLFTNIRSLGLHRNKFHEPMAYKCVECSYKRFYTKIRFINHLKLVHNKYEEKQIKCNECEQCFSTSSHSIQHMNELHSKPESSVEMRNCSETQVETESVSHNNNLINSEITEAKLFECQKCEVILKSSSDLSKHMIESHLSHGPVVNECEKPQINFETRSELDFEVHGNDVFDCDVCDFHESKHLSQRVKCPLKECDKTLANDYSLKKHLQRIHKINDQNLFRLL